MNSLIDIQNNPAIHSYLVNKFTRMGWTVSSNAVKENKQFWSLNCLPNDLPRFFTIEYNMRMFSCFSFDNDPNDDADVIATIEDAQALMRFVEVNCDGLRSPPKTLLLNGDKIDQVSYEDLYKEIKKASMNTTSVFFPAFEKSLKEEYYSKYHCGYYLSSKEPADKIGKEMEPIQTVDWSIEVSKWIAEGGYNMSADYDS